MLKGGIVGCGAIADISHMPAWQGMKGVEMVAVCDQNEKVAMATAKRWGIPSVYSDFSQMVNSEELDFLDICTPPLTHYQLAIQAIKAGLHVLVEKPMAVSLSEADEMVSASKEHGIKLCIVHNNLFSPVIQAAMSLVDTGAIGELVAVEIHALDRSDRYLSKQNHWCHSLPGGVLGEYAPHVVYLASAFLGNIRSVRAIARKYSEYPWVTADELKVLLEAENGLGALTISCNSPVTALTLSIFGTERNVHVNHFPQTMTFSRHRSGKIHGLVLDRLDLLLPVLTSAASGAVSQLLGRKRSRIGHLVIIQKFVESIRDDVAPPVTGEDGRETIRIIEEIWKQIGQPEG